MLAEQPTFADLVDESPTQIPATAVQRAVAVMTSLKDAALARFSKTEADLKALAEKYRNVAFDVTTTKGMADAKAARLELRESGRYAVQRIRDATKAEANELKRVIEDKAEALIGLVKPAEDAIDAQITAEEQRKAAEKAAKEAAEAAERERLAQIERQRVEAHEAGLAKIRGYLTRCEGLESGRIAIGISMLDGWTFGDDWQEFKPRAEETKAQTLAAMRALHEATKAREDEAARLEQQRIENERVAAENARIAADLKRQQDELAAAQAESARLEALAEANRAAAAKARTQEGDNRDASAGQSHVAEGSSSPTGRGENVTTAAGASPVSIPEAQAPQQVLKAEPATADATDRVEPANTSPRVGAMGAGQAADAAPSEEPATLNLGTICDRLGFKVTADFLVSLGVVHVATDKRSMLYRESQWPLICAQLLAHVGAMCELYAAEKV